MMDAWSSIEHPIRVVLVPPLLLSNEYLDVRVIIYQVK